MSQPMGVEPVDSPHDFQPVRPPAPPMRSSTAPAAVRGAAGALLRDVRHGVFQPDEPHRSMILTVAQWALGDAFRPGDGSLTPFEAGTVRAALVERVTATGLPEHVAFAAVEALFGPELT